MLMNFRCQQGLVPPYHADELQCVAYDESRQRLRSASTTALVVPCTLYPTIGDRAYPVAAAHAWNLQQLVTSSLSLTTFED